jgi:hypothetical protein
VRTGLLLLAVVIAPAFPATGGAASSGGMQPTTYQSTDRLVVPGESVGRVRLGMTRREVLALLGTPTESGDPLVYRARRGGHRLQVYFAGGRVEQIDFTSPAFQTRDGIGTRSYHEDRYAARFAMWRLRWRFVNLKHTLRPGGLTFYGLNVDSANPDYTVTYVGVVHRGAKPPHEALELQGEPEGGWTPWDGSDIYGG